MSKVFGVVFLLIGAALLYYGWREHEAATVEVSAVDAIGDIARTRSIWLFALGAITALWGLYALARRNVF